MINELICCCYACWTQVLVSAKHPTPGRRRMRFYCTLMVVFILLDLPSSGMLWKDVNIYLEIRASHLDLFVLSSIISIYAHHSLTASSTPS